ncbi:hypothetical protein ANN_27416 [Periplaneta americana]|uniref:DUF4817 domain-containing protein n=1 Tax=Periplaneta americana TaxID=6978 RepID=A0ABQ8RVS0_PERAM|nr:hypothetical protein ANN_27416 [Periplaneta americana]
MEGNRICLEVRSKLGRHTVERLNPEQRTKLIELYFENQRSIILTQRAYRRHFHVRHCPHQTTILRLVARFRQNYSVCDRPRTGRRRSVRTPENIERVRDSINDKPETSTRRRAAQLGMNRRSLQRILRTDLKLFAYKLQLVQRVSPADAQARLSPFPPKWCCQQTKLPNMGTGNPKAIVPRDLHPIRCTVWCGVTSERIIGPYFFEEKGAVVTVTGERYRNMIRDFLRPAVANNAAHWFQMKEPLLTQHVKPEHC